MKRRLSRRAVREIREWLAAYRLVPKPREICRRYGITRTVLYGIADGRTYKAVR